MEAYLNWISGLSANLLKNKGLKPQNSLASRLQVGTNQLDIIYGNESLKVLFEKALRHIKIPINGDKQFFTIFVLDNTCRTRYITQQGIISISNSEGKILTFNKDNWHMMVNPVSRVLSFVDTSNEVALYDIGNINDVPYFEIAAPMRHIMHWFCEKQGKTLIHAAAIGMASKSVLITGPGGSGKSSTALTCALRGMDYLGDDYVAIEKTNEARVLSVYNSAKYRWDAIERIPELKKLGNSWSKKEEKGFCFLNEFSAFSVKTNMSLAGVFLPMIEGHKRTAFIPCQSQKILLNLAASTIFQMPGSGILTLKNIINVLEGLPFYRISLGIDPEEIHYSISEFIENRM